jgi:plastocyanin
MRIASPGAAVGALLFAHAAVAAERTVTMSGLRYAPAAVEAKVGDVLRFVNDDRVDHDVFVPTRGFGVDLGVQKPGTQSELTLGKPGTFEVECVFHPHMLATVRVGR